MSRGTSTLGIDNVEIYTDRKPLIERQYGLPLFFIDDFFFKAFLALQRERKIHLILFIYFIFVCKNGAFFLS